MLFLAALPLLAASVRAAPIDLKLAERVFQEARWASDDDGGKLWGRPLYGPILFVEPASRKIVANQADAQGKLTRQGNVWVGELPKEVPPANTATNWAGVKWTMVQWPPPETPAERTLLLMHECFHRIQDEVGLPPAGPANAHLASKQGRTWLRLEYRALSQALISWGKERKDAITDALTFRSYRRSVIPGSAAEEDRMELHEGMAEYTGIRLMGLSDWDRRSFLSGRMRVNALKPSYSKSFAYETGPAYGLLLDMEEKPWRGGLKATESLSDLLKAAQAISIPDDLPVAAKARASVYGGEQVIADEELKEQDRIKREEGYRWRFIESDVLDIHLLHGNFSFDPNSVFPLGREGFVYPSSTISDDWGVIEVTGGVLMALTFDRIRVPAPKSASALYGDGWKITLKPGWKIVQGARKGDYTVAAAR